MLQRNELGYIQTKQSRFIQSKLIHHVGARAEVALGEREVVQAQAGRDVVQNWAAWFHRRSGVQEAECAGGRRHWRKQPPIPWH